MDECQVKEEAITIRMTGCPNGCARPYMAEIALVGTAYGHYNLHLGADFQGKRLNQKFKENLDEANILQVLKGIFTQFKSEKNPSETFGDFCVRKEFVKA
jgi:sulfite reductase (NADPH) hemoprotein beta-component